MGNLYSVGVDIHLLSFSYAHWAGDLDERCSISGYFFSLVYGLVCWCSKKQQGVGLSFAKTKYASATHAK
jgi:hypothetical protein